MLQTVSVEEEWRMLLTGTHPLNKRYRTLFGALPSNPRCKICKVPFGGAGGRVMRLVGTRPSNFNPHYCNKCDEFARTHLGGAEVELTMLFADVRGSTTLAEQMDTGEFSRLISRFYEAASQVMTDTDALIDKLVGDQVDGFYTPGFNGENHAEIGLKAAMEILHCCGYGTEEGPWIPVGAGVHTGMAFIGAVGSVNGIADLTALGDAVNVAARLASSAGPGEILVSDETISAIGFRGEGLELRELILKGKTNPVKVRVLRVD